MDEEGYLFITDRIKDLVTKGGYNTYPSEIEGYLEEHPSIAESTVIDYATSKITPFKAPSKVKFVDALPKSLVGKILKIN